MIREVDRLRYLDTDTPKWFRDAVPLDLRRWPTRIGVRPPEETQER